jgi:hypothetical protein
VIRGFPASLAKRSGFGGEREAGVHREIHTEPRCDIQPSSSHGGKLGKTEGVPKGTLSLIALISPPLKVARGSFSRVRSPSLCCYGLGIEFRQLF